MKELSIEEKAKAYDEAIKVAEKYHNGTLKDVMETIFPKLKESEDERVLKIIKETLKSYNSGIIFGSLSARDYTDCLAWLEKKEEQIPTEWGEEDERMYKAISIALSLDEAKGYLRSWYITPEEADTWLKSLKDRYTWKPSDEQMKALNEAIYHVDDSVATQIAMLIGKLSKL